MLIGFGRRLSAGLVSWVVQWQGCGEGRERTWDLPVGGETGSVGCCSWL